MIGAVTDQPHPNVARVTAAADAAGLRIEVRRFPAGTRTAADAARAVGCEVAQIVKSLVFLVDDAPVLALVSGANRLVPDRLAEELGARGARRASGDEVRQITGFAIGGVPPVGHTSKLSVVVDPDLLRHELVWVAAGLPDAVFAIEPQRLAEAADARVLEVTEPLDS